MKTTKTTLQNNEMTDRAWKELMEALRSERPAVNEPVNTPKRKTKHHPAIITTTDLCNWEIFG